MKVILQTRLMLWKKQGISLLFWLLFPVLITWIIITQSTAIQEETKVPIGIVMEEETLLSQQLVESLKETAHIRPILLEERDALNQLQKHELDSVFIIRNRYEDNIQKGSRNQLIKSYQSDLSFAYTPLRETVTSYVQQDYSRSKAAYKVQRIGEEYGVTDNLIWEELVARSKEIEQEQKLLEVEFSFANTDVEAQSGNESIFELWNVWALFSMLATFMVFDWLIKENRKSLMPRFTLGKIPYRAYLLWNAFLYTVLLLLFDLFAVAVFVFLLEEALSISLLFAIIGYRLMLNSCIFIFSKFFRSVYVYYISAFATVLFVALLSGALIPIEGITRRWGWIDIVNPLGAFISGNFLNIWLVLGIVSILGWYGWKGKIDA